MRISGRGWAWLGLVLIAQLSLSCAKARNEERQFGALPLVIYTSHPAELVRVVTDEYRDRAAIPLRIVRAGTGELLARLRKEAGAPEADLLWGGGVESLAANADLFSPYVSREIDMIVPAYRDPGARWSAFTVLPMVIAYNRRLLAPDTAPHSWAALLDGGFDGAIALADPLRSGSAYTILGTIETALAGEIGGVGGRKVTDRLAAVLGGRLLSESAMVVPAVASGEYLVGLCYENAALAEGSELGLVYPAEGTSALPDGVALVKGGPNAGAAKAFIDFVLGADVASVVANRFGRRSARRDAPLPAGVPPLESIRLVPYDLEAAARNREADILRFRGLVENAAPVSR